MPGAQGEGGAGAHPAHQVDPEVRAASDGQLKRYKIDYQLQSED